MDKIKTFFIILISLLALASGGFALTRYLQIVGAIIFSVLSIIWLLVLSGLVGPKSLRNKIREFQVWSRTKTVLFFPIHPYKPIDEALKGGVKEFLPTRERVKNFLTYGLLFRAVSFVLAIIIIGGFLAWRYFGAPKEEIQMQGGEAKESRLISFDIFPSCKDRYDNTIYSKGAKAVAIGENLSKVEFWLVPSGTGVRDTIFQESEVIKKDNLWEVLLSREGTWAPNFYAVGYDLAGRQVAKIFLGFISEGEYPENCAK